MRKPHPELPDWFIVMDGHRLSHYQHESGEWEVRMNRDDRHYPYVLYRVDPTSTGRDFWDGRKLWDKYSQLKFAARRVSSVKEGTTMQLKVSDLRQLIKEALVTEGYSQSMRVFEDIIDAAIQNSHTWGDPNTAVKQFRQRWREENPGESLRSIWYRDDLADFKAGLPDRLDPLADWSPAQKRGLKKRLMRYAADIVSGKEDWYEELIYDYVPQAEEDSFYYWFESEIDSKIPIEGRIALGGYGGVNSL